MRSAPAELTTAQAALLAVAAGAVGCALQVSDGGFHPVALALVLVAVACAGAVAGRPPWFTCSAAALARLLAAIALAQIALLALRPMARDLEPGPAGPWPAHALLALAAALVAALALAPERHARWLFPALLVVHAALGAWVLRHAPPETDVFQFERGGVAALLQGHDPYAVRFRNPYHPYTGFYPPGFVRDGVLRFGYPYMPLSLLATVPAALLGADLRLAHLAAYTLAGAAVGLARPGRVAPLAAAVLLFSPRFAFVLQMAWTEPVAVLFVAATVLAAARAPRLAPVAFGLALASKQYLILIAPAGWLLLAPLPRARRLRFVLVAAGVALAVTLSLALRHPREFLRSAVLLHLQQPFRADALSVAAALARAGAPPLGWMAFVLAAVAVAIACRRLPATAAGFAAAVAITLLAFLVWNRQAMCNYWFVPLAALVAAVAASRPST